MYLLTSELRFPPPESATADGVVAVGGDVSPERLILGYSQGIFPWPVDGLPLLWFCPDPRFALVPSETRIPRSLRKSIRKGRYEIRTDTAFSRVIRACAETPRPNQRGTWITSPLINGYNELHRLGYAHSVEAYLDGELAGGLYGVSLGRVFFGESMFSRADDASKVAFVTLVGQLVHWNFGLIDCQVYTSHLARFGARKVRRKAFLAQLQAELEHPPHRGAWELDVTPTEALDLLRNE